MFTFHAIFASSIFAIVQIYQGTRGEQEVPRALPVSFSIIVYKDYISKTSNQLKISAPIGAWKYNFLHFSLLGNYERSVVTIQPTDRPTDMRGHTGKLHFQKLEFGSNYCERYFAV